MRGQDGCCAVGWQALPLYLDVFEAFAIAVLEAASSLETGRKLLGLSWDGANSIIKRAVERGLSQRDITDVERVGIDEKAFLRGHSYMTLLNDLDGGRVLDVVPERTEAACRELINKGSWRIPLVFWDEARFSPSGFIHVSCSRDYLGTTDLTARVAHFCPELTADELEEVRLEADQKAAI